MSRAVQIVRRTARTCRGRAGMTLVEVLLAAAILALGLTSLLIGISSCLAVMRASREFESAQWVLGAGELKYPIRPVEDLEELNVDGDTDLAEGYRFEREVQEKELLASEEDDGLYELRTRVSWGEGGPGESEEVVRLVWKRPTK